MFYDKSYVLSDYLNYDDLNELVDKEKELINEVAYQEVGDTENVLVNGKEYETGSDYFLEGNAIQNGSPTPTSPVEIRNISGSQDITVSERNIFDYTKNSLYSNAVDTTVIENGIRASVRTAGAYRYIVFDIGKTIDLVGKTIRFKCNFAPSSTNVSGYALIYCDSVGGNRNTISSATTSGQTISATVGTTKTNIAILLYTNMNSTSQPVGTYTDFTNIMITVDDSDMTYEEFKGQNYEINLGNIELCKIGDYQDKIFKSKGKQLFDKDNINLIDSYYVDGTGKIVAGTNNKFNWVKLEPNKTYTLSQPIKSNVTVRPSLFSETPSPNVIGTVLGTFTGTTPIIQTFTTNDTDIYFGWVYCNTAQLSGHTQQEMLDCIMINEGSIALPYEPYNSYDKWLLHKEISKVVLDGSEEYIYQNNTFRINISDLTTIGDSKIREISNYYQAIPYSASWSNYDYFVSNTNGSPARIVIKNKDITSTSNFKTWLSTHNTIVYYVLNTPTTTEITDTELISELEEISNKIKYWNYEQILPIENYDLDLPIYELNDFVYLEDINKIEKNIMQLSYDFYQPPGYIKNKIWRTEEDLDVYKSFSYEDMNRMITDMNILYEHRIDTTKIYNLYTNENWDGETTLEWE